MWSPKHQYSSDGLRIRFDVQHANVDPLFWLAQQHHQRQQQQREQLPDQPVVWIVFKTTMFPFDAKQRPPVRPRFDSRKHSLPAVLRLSVLGSRGDQVRLNNLVAFLPNLVRIDTADICQFQQYLRFNYLSRFASQLQVLNLQNSELDDLDLRLLAHLKHVRHLSIAHTRKVTDQGMKSLARLQSLVSLDVTNVPGISSKGLACLSVLTFPQEDPDHGTARTPQTPGTEVDFFEPLKSVDVENLAALPKLCGWEDYVALDTAKVENCWSGRGLKVLVLRHLSQKVLTTGLEAFHKSISLTMVDVGATQSVTRWPDLDLVPCTSQQTQVQIPIRSLKLIR